MRAFCDSLADLLARQIMAELKRGHSAPDETTAALGAIDEVARGAFGDSDG